MNTAEHNIYITFPISYSLLILSFDTIESELLRASFNKPHIK
jgi:hypothetical protein